MEQMMAVQSVIGIVSHLLFIIITWWAMQALDVSKFIKKNKVQQARVFMIFLNIAIGVTVSNFFLEYFLYARQIPGLFQ